MPAHHEQFNRGRMFMTLKYKILLRISIFTFLIIGAMSVTYYYVFTRDARERSYQELRQTFALIFDDLTARIRTTQGQLDLFVQHELLNPLSMLEILQTQQEAGQSLTLWQVKKELTYLSQITSSMQEFASMTEAAAVIVYNARGMLAAFTRQDGGAWQTGGYMPHINAEAMIPLQAKDKWYAMLMALDELRFEPLPETFPLAFRDGLPATRHIGFGALEGRVTLRFAMPVFDREKAQGVCVVHLPLRQADVERYAKLSGTEVNVFAGSVLSVGTLPHYAALETVLLEKAQPLNLLTLTEAPAIVFHEMQNNHAAYYQGSVIIGSASQPISAMTVHFPRSLEEAQKRRFLLIVAGIAVFFGALAVFESLVQSGAIVAPIHRLMRAMKAVEGGDLSVKADIQTRDELQRLAESFNVMTVELQEHLNQKEEQERLRNEMELARRIQTAILPNNMAYDGFEIEAVMLPAEEVGGDYYDVLIGKDGALWLAIGDVSGHGVTPGLVMMIAQTIHATIATQYSATPKEVIEMVNRVLFQSVHDRLHADHFMTFATLKYEGSGRFTHAGAHLDLIVHRQATQLCELIDTSGVFLNFIPEIAHATTNASFTLDVGDTLVLYTDGLTEAWNADKVMLDVPRFVEIVRRHAGNAASDMRDAIMQDVLTWCGGQRDDDMSLVIVRRNQ